MGDYRNELQSALAQIEALRTENAALRARLRRTPDAPAGRDDSDPGLPRPTETSAPPPRSLARQALVVTAGCVLLAAGVVLTRPQRMPEAPLHMPDAPVVPVAGSRDPLPMPPTSVRLPERPKPPVPISEVVEERFGPLEPSSLLHASGFDRGVQWQSGTHGLYVLTTVPEAECSVGGVRFTAPRPVFLEPGVYPVRCEAGHARHLWSVRIASHQVTFDLEHRIGR